MSALDCSGRRLTGNRTCSRSAENPHQALRLPDGGAARFSAVLVGSDFYLNNDGIDKPAEGTYPFVSHAFAHVQMGQVGILKVGNPKGSVEH